MDSKQTEAKQADGPRPLTAKDQAEHARLLDLWATRRATRSQILRCRDFDRRCAAIAKGAAQ